MSADTTEQQQMRKAGRATAVQRVLTIQLGWLCYSHKLVLAVVTSCCQAIPPDRLRGGKVTPPPLLRHCVVLSLVGCSGLLLLLRQQAEA